MNERQKKRVRKFIDALRSGEYQQGQDSLHLRATDNEPAKFCCLGVACQVALKNRVELKVYEGFRQVSYNDESGYLPDKLVEYYGFDSTDPILIDDNNIRIAATTANDSQGYDFTKIADLFERTYLAEETADVAT